MKNSLDDLQPYVMFGQNPFFGDLADLIHRNGGYLKKVVVNVPDPPRPGVKSFAQRVAEYDAWMERNGYDRKLEIQELDDYRMDESETCVMGFRGTSSRPLRQFLMTEHGVRFPTIVHPTAHVSPFAELAEGSVICAQANIASFVKLGAFCVLNRCASIGHDTIVGDDVDISPNAALGSAIRVSDAVRIGIHSTVIEYLQLGEGCYVAAGSAVIRDVPAHTLVAGVPAVEKKKLR